MVDDECVVYDEVVAIDLAAIDSGLAGMDCGMCCVLFLDWSTLEHPESDQQAQLEHVGKVSRFYGTQNIWN